MGVKKPDDNPTRKLTGKLEDAKQEKPRFLNEKKIIEKLNLEQNKSLKKNDQKQDKKDSKQDTTADKKEETETDNGESLPLTARKNGVTLEISKISKEGSSLTLDVSLRNEGSQPVKFLYSFLEVRDDRDRALSAITDGLPSEIPSNGENFPGTIRIPAALLDDVSSLSLVLTDYPDQKLELKLDKIPVSN